jgi:serine/threonine protein kinase
MAYHSAPIRMQSDEGIPLATIREASLLTELSHPNILKLESVYVNSNATDFALSLIFEFVDHDIHEMMQARSHSHQETSREVNCKPYNLIALSSDSMLVTLCRFRRATRIA